MKKIAFIATVVALQLSTGALAQLRTGRTAEASSLPSTTQQGRSQLDETARAVQQMWGLTADEMQRAEASR